MSRNRMLDGGIAVTKKAQAPVPNVIVTRRGPKPKAITYLALTRRDDGPIVLYDGQAPLGTVANKAAAQDYAEKRGRALKPRKERGWQAAFNQQNRYGEPEQPRSGGHT